MRQIRTVSIGEVQAFLQNHPGGFLIDVLPPEFHAQQHIPGSSGVCVFETAFQEKMRALVPDMAAPLLVYGAGGSLDSAVAAEKLQREGYTDISLFAGGLEAWRKAGLPAASPRLRAAGRPRFFSCRTSFTCPFRSGWRAISFCSSRKLSSGDASSTKMNSASARVCSSNDRAQRTMNRSTLYIGTMTETLQDSLSIYEVSQ